MSDIRRFTPDDLVQLSASAIAKIDLLGPEGTSHCTSDEVEAMATMIVLAGLLPAPLPVLSSLQETPTQRTNG